jgi:DNA-binding transcriptional regulator YhcF (GntR family)
VRDSLWTVTSFTHRICRMKATDIQIDSASDIPIREQLTEQIVFRIATGAMTPEQPLPSVRELARRLKIHHNTVSGAYQDLVRNGWVARRRGSRLVVISRETLAVPRSAKSLDDIINLTIHLARAMGFSLQVLRERVRERLKSAPPDHILVIEGNQELREILCDEIRCATPYPVRACSQDDLAANPSLAIGAMAVAPLYSIGKTDELFPKDRPVVAVAFSKADEHIQRIRDLRQPSMVAVVSASPRFLEVARSILAPAIGTRHQLHEVLLPGETPPTTRSADLIFCDSVVKRSLRLSKVVHYQLVAEKSLEEVANAMKSYQGLV